MELKLNMKSCWSDTDYTYTVYEDNSDPTGLIAIEPKEKVLYLTKEGIKDLIDILNLLYNRL